MRKDNIKLLSYTIERIKEKNKEVFNQMREILDKIYKDRWDIQVLSSLRDRLDLNGSEFTKLLSKCLESNEAVQLVIHFPDITITNTRKDTHNIKDLYVVLKFAVNMKLFSFDGFRTTLTNIEAFKGYSHSHLSTNRVISWFCTGSGPISTSISYMRATGFDAIKFQILCLNIDKFVKWESLEGVPYIRINTLNSGIYNDVPEWRIDEILNEQINDIPFERILPYLKVRYLKNKIIVNYDKELAKVLLSYLKNVKKYNIEDISGFYTERGTYLSSAAAVILEEGPFIKEFLNHNFYFKNQKLEPKIIDIDCNKGSNYLHKQITDEYVKRIETFFRNRYISSPGTYWEKNNDSTLTEDSESNQLVEQEISE